MEGPTVPRKPTLADKTVAIGFVLAANAAAFWQIIVIYGTLIGLGVGFAGLLTGQTVAMSGGMSFN